MPKCKPNLDDAGNRVPAGLKAPRNCRKVVESGGATGRYWSRRYDAPTSGVDPGNRAFDRDAALLNDSGLSGTANGIQRAMIVRKLQRDYGTGYVRRLIEHTSGQALREAGGAAGVTEGQLPSQASARIRNARSFRNGPRVRRPADLRPGVAWVVSNGGHIRIVAEVTAQQDHIQFVTVESRGGRQGGHGPTRRTWRTGSLEDFRPIRQVGRRRGNAGGTFHEIPGSRISRSARTSYSLAPFPLVQTAKENELQMKPLVQRQAGLDGGDVDLGMEEAIGKAGVFH